MTESQAEASGSSAQRGTPRDFDRPLNLRQAFAGRFNRGTGRGSLHDNRAGYAMIDRPAWDDLWDLQRLGALTPQELLLILALVTRAGFRPDRMGVVMGFDHELAEVLKVRRHAVRAACKHAERLGLGEDLVLDGEGRVGFRFGKEAFVWLVGMGKNPPRPRLVEEALIAAATKKAGGQPPEPRTAVDLGAAAFRPRAVDLDDDEEDPLAPPRPVVDDGDPWA